MLELSARLQNSERERDVAQRKLTDALEERERSQRRLESIGATHESRITEMHCIIVELNRKLKTRQDNAIMEEHEPEGSGECKETNAHTQRMQAIRRRTNRIQCFCCCYTVSELSFQDGSVYNSEMECTNHEETEDSPTEPLDVKLVQPVQRSCESPATLPPPQGNSQIQVLFFNLVVVNIMHSSLYSLQVQAMHEECLHLRGQVALLQSQLAAAQQQSQPLPQLPTAAADDDDADDDGDDDIDDGHASGHSADDDGDDDTDHYHHQQPTTHQQYHNHHPNNRKVTTPLLMLPSPAAAVSSDHSPRAGPRSTYTSDDHCETADIFGARAMAVVVNETNDRRLPRRSATATKRQRAVRPAVDAGIDHHVASVTLPTATHHHQPHLSKQHAIAVRHRTVDRAAGGGGLPLPRRPYLDLDAPLPGSDSTQPNSADDEDAEDASERSVRRMNRDLKHSRLQSQILALTVAESRAHCNRLYLLCGKYESNAIALHQALCCSDRAVEAYDVMLALLESRLAIVESAANRTATASAAAAAVPQDVVATTNATANHQQALESRRAAEAVAQHLLTRLARPEVSGGGSGSSCGASGDSPAGSGTWLGNSLGPWNEAIVLTAADTEMAAHWTDADDRRLRAAVSKLKGQRATIQSTVVALEAPFSGCDEEPTSSAVIEAGGVGGSAAQQAQASEDVRRHYELEATVLAQEVVGLQQELSQSRQRAEHAVRDRTASYKRAAAMQEALLHLQAQLADTEQRLVACTNAGVSESG